MNSQEFFTKMEQYIQQELQSGCDYNILLALHKDSNEVNLHSRFIYSLLNPNGYHYKGDSFLKEFLKICGCDFTFDVKKIEVSVEYSTAEYRRVDLVIKDGNKCVIIENKVNAKDRERQLIDYVNHFYINEKYKRENIYAIYLSPDSRDPSGVSIGNNNMIKDGYLVCDEDRDDVRVKFKSISYQKEIKQWIESCRNDCSSDMKLILNQYLSVLKSLNGELEYQRDKLEYEYIKEHYKEVEAFYNSLKVEEKQRIENVKINIIKEFMDEVVKKFEKHKEEDGLKAENYYNDSRGWMSIYNPKWIPNDEAEIILFWVFIGKDNKLYIKIAANRILYEKYKHKDAKWGERIKKAFKPYKKERLDFGECDLSDKTKIAKVIIEGRVKADEIAKQINGFVSKYKDKFIEINENAKEKTHEFWKNLPKP
ncbi:PDDEXK-like family protein [Campylobacter sp. RM16187]|uniref:PDDEXK-like family protein n=1 Tax=Campylobacter sp. RM16187 TaxID=1660063 RepID=UPI0021B671ED|nr:PD-(D/E)XK nuclease family protein [Campylobacter sp. RM16187]QKG30017.1 PD-(D/E)XK nuclease domain protein [Campylobacter sp. RM16187]